MSDDTITITKADLQQMISEGIAQAISKPRERTPQALFQGIAIDYDDLSVINNRYGLETAALHDANIYSRHQSRDWLNRVCDGGPGRADVHDLIRKLAMAICGETQNSKVARMDYDRVRNDYEQFRNLFLKLYDARCSDLITNREVKTDAKHNHD
jgi:hypothetical protein